MIVDCILWIILWSLGIIAIDWMLTDDEIDALDAEKYSSEDYPMYKMQFGVVCLLMITCGFLQIIVELCRAV